MRSIVLIGMPGSGKTTVGALLSARLGMPLVDTDALVEAAAGRPIPEIFAADGEEAFRDLETEAARRAARMEGAVIATGGGIVKRPRNMELLAAAGPVFFLDRPPEEIAGDDHSGRPLVGEDRARIFQLYQERIALYLRYGQHRIAGCATAEEAAGQIARLFEKVGKV